ncbi:hypothetical protein [Clostridium folliculivorans]|uniref:Uncharacterized protein n=1 Tax=Clostridium folliculivorans TaxID=2886038 RepID=A0A9W6DAG7_9CLOT|nr:hypothetical protein [Clostridium folliculivorans]GKU25199.1 hypothetical protein CFOLD11_20250 [Clostridium folliculivorans]GKU31297.1 hypothetical protein CFB3_34040 [Clostridium folliculivorans]
MSETNRGLTDKKTNKDRAYNNKVKNSVKGSEKSILLQVDEATKGIMKEIQSGITDDIINTVSEHSRLLRELNEKIDETYDLAKENNKLLKQILKNQKRTEE